MPAKESIQNRAIEGGGTVMGYKAISYEQCPQCKMSLGRTHAQMQVGVPFHDCAMGGFVVLKNVKEWESFTTIEAANLRSDMVVRAVIYGVVAFVLSAVIVFAGAFIKSESQRHIYKQGYQFYFMMLAPIAAITLTLLLEFKKFRQVVTASRTRTAESEYRERLRAAGFQLSD